jgi:pyruvate/2-oxoglutarate dehydrogenase complex dihydrolipoamide acyltransferase (E2) component
MKTTKRLLQLLCAAFILAAPALAQAQAFPFPPSYGPYGPAFGPVVTPLPGISNLFGDALENTPLDPYATTVHVRPPTGGTVMLYRGNALRGWWMQPGLVTVQPDVLYSLVATRGTTVLYASGIVFRPGYTAVAWTGNALPRIGYQPAWTMGYPGGRYAARPSGHGHSHGSPAPAPEPAAPTAAEANAAEPAALKPARRLRAARSEIVALRDATAPEKRMAAPTTDRAKRAAVKRPAEALLKPSTAPSKKGQAADAPKTTEKAPAKQLSNRLASRVDARPIR